MALPRSSICRQYGECRDLYRRTNCAYRCLDHD
jgi:hypothetical protein